MKQVGSTLNDYMNTEKNFETCDIYALKLKSGSTYYFADYDKDIVWNAHVWKHDRGLFRRGNLKLNGTPVVDTLSITISCDVDDKIDNVPLMKACHDGLLEQAMLKLYKVYLKDGSVVDVLPLFEGRTEVAGAGGLQIKLTVKSIIQGLACLVPVRIFAPEEAYKNANGTVVVSDSDTASALIPLKPSARVLVKV